MFVLFDAVNLLTTPPGGLVYHLVVLFCIEAILGIALGQWQRDRQDKAAWRLSVAAGLLLLSRLVLMGIALLSWQGFISSAEVVPPLERGLDTVTLVLLCWTFVLSSIGNKLIPRLFLAMGLIVTVTTYLAFAFLWSSDLAVDQTLAYNGSWQDIFWTLGQLLLLGLTGVLLIWRRPGQWGFLLTAFGTMGLGLVLHLTVPYTLLSTDLLHIAGWVRPANLIAFPLLAIAVYRDVVRGLSRRTRTLEDISQESLSQITGLLSLLETSQYMSSSLDLNTVVNNAVKGMARVLNSNLCGLALLLEGQDELQLVGLYRAGSRAGQQTGEVRFSISEYQAIEHAIRRRKQVILEDSGDSPQVHGLYALLGSEGSGPLLVQPLLGTKAPLGVIIVGNTGSRRPFSVTDGKLCQTLAKQIVVALENARLHYSLVQRMEQQARAARQQEAEAAAQQSALAVELQQTKEDLELFTQRLYELESQMRESRTQVEQLTEQLAQETADHRQKQALWESDMRRIQEEAARLTTHLVDIQQEHMVLQEECERLRREKASLETQLQEMQEKAREKPPLPEVPAEGTGPDFTLLDSLSGGIVVSGGQGEIVWINATAEAMLARSRKTVLGSPLSELVPTVEWRAAVSSALGSTATEVNVSVDGRTLHAFLSPVLATDGRVEGLTALLIDISAEEERRREKDSFVASLAHELRTPMTSIMGYTDLLMSDSVGMVGDMQRNFLQRVKANIERMEVMLNNLIGVTAIDTGQLQIELEPVDMRQVIEETISGAQAQLQEKKLTLKLKQPKSFPTLYADPECVHQIMVNLLANACKASREGGVIHIRVQVHEEPQEDLDVAAPFLLVSVTDAGEGIAPEDLPHVFDRFYRADHPLISGLGETDVGLAVVKAMVEAHHGHVWVKSKKGEGSTFSFALPLGQSAAP
ncbi:MAG: ATP-binding protein [Anaerolineae bacterium]|jgi:signal transduction histidine kinase/GAF domain-containing protein|nr:ATP-binding protein [Anaerolineae bacterium]MDH7474935.1 ATP-binding protein [Anaerolineae bacterium]